MITLILGPTGIGKSTYALKLAHEQDAEIVSVDALQVYKHMNIGTAKLSLEEREGIVHHMIDIVEPSVQFSVADYIDGVREILSTNKKNLIFCGGAGLHHNALINGLAFPIAKKNDEVRAELKTRLETQGKEYLWAELNKVDPEAAAKIHPNDSYRTMRALEVYKLTGQKFSTQAIKAKSILGEDYQIIGLTTDRAKLYEKLDQRVDKMLKQGLAAEVKGLLEKGYGSELSAMQALGYKEIIGFIQNSYSLEKAVELIKQGTRRFAKRQYTWFRAFKNVQWQEV